MMRLLLVITLAYICFQALDVIQNKYISEDFLENTIDKVVEIGSDTADTLSLVYETHNSTGE